MSDNFEFSLCYNLREGESVCCYGRKELPWSCRLLHVLKWMKKTNVRREYPDICVVTIIHKAIKYKEQWGIVIGKETSGKTGSIHFSSSTIVPSQADHSKQKSNCYFNLTWWLMRQACSWGTEEFGLGLKVLLYDYSSFFFLFFFRPRVNWWKIWEKGFPLALLSEWFFL